MPYLQPTRFLAIMFPATTPSSNNVHMQLAQGQKALAFSWNDNARAVLTIVVLVTTDGPYGPDVMAGECYFIAKPIYNEERLGWNE